MGSKPSGIEGLEKGEIRGGGAGRQDLLGFVAVVLGVEFELGVKVEDPVPSNKVRDVVRVGMITKSAEGFLLEPEVDEVELVG